MSNTLCDKAVFKKTKEYGFIILKARPSTILFKHEIKLSK